MTISVTGGEIQPVRHALGHGRLQAIVVGPGKIFRHVNKTKGAKARKRTAAESALGYRATLIIGTDASSESVENERMLALIDVLLTQQVTSVIADVAHLQREVAGDGVLHPYVVIHHIGSLEIRIHAPEAAR